MARNRANGEGSVYFDSDKDRWVGSTYVDGRRRKVLGRTKTEARLRLDQLRAKAAAGEQVGDGNMTVAQLLTGWEARSVASRDLAPSTVETYRWCADRLRDTLGGKRVRSLTAEHVEAALDVLAGGDSEHRPLGRSALVKIRSVLGQALDYAVRRGHATRNAARFADIAPSATRPRARRSLNVEEAKTLLAAVADHRLEALLTIMLMVGLRPGEATGLLWDDVDLAAGRIAIRHGVRLVKRRPVIVDELKTTRSRRTITLPATAAEALRDHRHCQSAERLAATSWADDRLVFASRAGTVLHPRNVARDLRKITIGAGLGPWTPNELRHSAASILSASGVPLEQIADLLGHTNTRMLEQTYRHAVQPSIEAAVGPMDRLLGIGGGSG